MRIYIHESFTSYDLKDTNALLDSDLKLQISDFGLARVLEGDRSYNVMHEKGGT
jgi:serine/threonine protein kinase